MKGSVAEIFDVDKGHPNMNKWDESRKRRGGEILMPLGRCNIITYGRAVQERGTNWGRVS